MSSNANVGMKLRSTGEVNKVEDNLEKYLKDNFDDDVIKMSSRNPDKDNYKSVSIKCFDNISDNTFNKFIKDNSKTGYIYLNKLAHFLTNDANTKNTRGKYHELMNMIHAMYNVNIIDNLPDYSSLDKSIKDKIMPKREEYLICWLIKHLIDNDKLLSQYLYFNGKPLTTPLYQKSIENIDERYYDMIFDELDIVVEIQEDDNAHKDNTNDELKEALVKVRSKRIIYFKLVDFNTNIQEYLKLFWNDLKEMLIQSLLNYNASIRNAYCVYSFKNDINDKCLEFQKDIKQIKKKIKNPKNVKAQIDSFGSELLKLNEKFEFFNLFNNTDASLINQIFNWKLLEKDDDTYVVDVDDAFKLRITTDKNIEDFKNFIINEYKQDIKYGKIEGVVNKNKIFIQWNTLIFITMKSSIDQFKKDIIIHYLLNIQTIYEDIIRKIQMHHNDKFNITGHMYKLVIDHTTKKYVDQYENKNKILTKKFDIANYRVKLCLQDIKRNDGANKMIIELAEGKFTAKKDIKLLNNAKEYVKKSNEFYNQNIGDYITIRKKYNESIIREFPDFPVVYTGNIDNRISYNNLASICKHYNISKNSITLICESFLINYNIKTKYIYNICILTDLEPLSESESESDSDEEDESKDTVYLDSDNEDSEVGTEDDA